MKTTPVKKNYSDFLLCPPNSDFGEVKVPFDFVKPYGHSVNSY